MFIFVVVALIANLGLPPHQDPYATNEDDGELEDDFEDDDSDIDEDFEEPEDLQSDLETKYSSDPLANVVPLVSATTAAGNGPLTVKSAVGGANWGEVPAPPVLPIPAKTEELKGNLFFVF